MNYSNPQDQEGTEYFHSFTDSPPITTFSSSSTTTPSPLAIASTTMAQNNLYINDEWRPSYIPSNLTENINSSSGMTSPMVFNFASSSSYTSSITPTAIIGNASSFHPGYFAPVPTTTTTAVPISDSSSFSPSLSTSSYTTGYFTSINGMIHSSVPSQSHYSDSSFEYVHYVPQQQQSTSTPPPPLPLQIQRISQQQHSNNNNQQRGRVVEGGSGQRKRKRRQISTNTLSTSSSPSPTSSSSGLVETVFQEPQHKRQKYHRHSSDPSSSTSRMVSTESRSTSPYSNSVTPLPSPVLQRENLEINIREGDSGGGRDSDDSGGEEIKIEEEYKEEKLLKRPQNTEKIAAGGANKTEQATTSVPSQQKQKTVKDIETELSFLRDECATILMMLESLRNAFLADETNKQIHQEITVKPCSSSSKNKKTSSVVKDRKLAMEREMRIGYDDLMLQVRQLERKVEKLEGKSKSICNSDRG